MKEDFTSPISFIKGKFAINNQAKISIFDLGFTRSYGVFEFLRTYNLKPFLLEDHLQRLFKSAKILGIKHNFKFNYLKKLIFTLIKKNKHLKSELNIRIFLTGGESHDFLFSQKPNLYILITPLKKLPESYYSKGVKIITKNFHRDFPQAKSLNYSMLIKFLKEAKRKKATEVLLVNNQEILEGATSNFFAVIKGRVITPPSNKILEGITRKFILHLLKKYRFPYQERKLLISEIKDFQECFLTATNKEILPVVQIDNFKINNGKPGIITLKLRELFYKETNERH
ncbi:D-alanine aminotransferase [bacterium HR35]|nr:D-alanine aminotransferase [bacterium HR35]